MYGTSYRPSVQVKRVRLSRGARPPGTQAASDEQRRRSGPRGHGEPRAPDPLLTPADGEPDDEQPGFVRRLDHGVLPRLDKEGVRIDPGHVLEDERGVREQPARITATAGGVGGRAEKPERRAQDARDPGADFRCRPVVVGSAERHEHRAARAGG